VFVVVDVCKCTDWPFAFSSSFEVRRCWIALAWCGVCAVWWWRALGGLCCIVGGHGGDGRRDEPSASLAELAASAAASLLEDGAHATRGCVHLHVTVCSRRRVLPLLLAMSASSSSASASSSSAAPAKPSFASAAAAGASAQSEQEESQRIVQHYKGLRAQISETANKINELDSDRNEHELVLRALTGLDPARRCYRSIGGVLVERTIAEVQPAVQKNLKGVRTKHSSNTERHGE
jgi:chaperonin cofactor prefoldin